MSCLPACRIQTPVNMRVRLGYGLETEQHGTRGAHISCVCVWFFQYLNADNRLRINNIDVSV